MRILIGFFGILVCVGAGLVHENRTSSITMIAIAILCFFLAAKR